MFDETDLYPPVKAFLEAQGYAVKAEINSCDVVGQKQDGSVVIVELKKGFNLDLLIQGVERLSLSDDVYLAAGFSGPIAKGSILHKRRRGVEKVCKRLGLGLMMVRLHNKREPKVEVLLDPAPYSPRKNTRHVARLKKEFSMRVGDPNSGGSSRTKIITAYRQNALRCAVFLKDAGPSKVKDIKQKTGVEKVASILQKNFYGWFERTERGIYTLNPQGERELAFYADAVRAIENSGSCE